MKKLINSRRGVTLIELLIVATIIGIIAAVFIPEVSKTITAVKDIYSKNLEAGKVEIAKIDFEKSGIPENLASVIRRNAYMGSDITDCADFHYGPEDSDGKTRPNFQPQGSIVVAIYYFDNSGHLINSYIKEFKND